MPRSSSSKPSRCPCCGHFRSQPKMGADNPASVLSEKEVKQIIALIDKGIKDRQLAEQYCVGRSTIQRIRLGQSWINVPRPKRWNT